MANTKKSVAPVISAMCADAQALDSVVASLDAACAAGKTMAAKAREAAICACAGNFLTAPPAERAEKIVALYMPHLAEKSVKEAFSAIVAVLSADKPVRIQSAEAGQKAPSADYPSGMATFKAPEVLSPVADAKEVIPDGRIVTEFEAAEAVEKLPIELIKKVGTMARELMGTGRAKGAGRPKTATETRAPFMAEFSAAWVDDALRLQIIQIIRASGFDVVKSQKNRARVEQSAAPTMAQQAGA